MHKRVFDQIAQRIGNCWSVSNDVDRVIGAGQRDGPAGRQRQMRHRADNLLGELPQIDK